MRVRLEPRARTPRRQLDEILAPHGLVAREGPGGILQIVRAPSPCGAALVANRAEPDGRTIGHDARARCRPTRNGSPSRRRCRGGEPIAGVAEETVNRRELTTMPAGLVDDPRSGDPFDAARRARGRLPQRVRGEGQPLSSRRGRCRRGLDVVAAARAGAESASVSMFTTQLLESATLRAGAYARTYGDRLGPQLELTLREGARDRLHVNGTVSNTAATIVAEGPIGGGARLVDRGGSSEPAGMARRGSRVAVPVFGFSDAMGKLVFDVTRPPPARILAAGRQSRVDVDEDVEGGRRFSGPRERQSRTSRGARRSVRRAVLTQRAYLIRQVLRPSIELGPTRWSTGRQLGDQDAASACLQSGAQLGRTTWNDGDRSAAGMDTIRVLNLQTQAPGTGSPFLPAFG